MQPYLYEIIFNRGPMPFVSILTCLAALVLVAALRPQNIRAYLTVLFICLLPVLAGYVGYRMGIHAANEGWANFMAGNPTAIEGAKMNLEIGKMVARDPLYLGIALSLLPALVNTLVFLKRRKI